MLFQFTTQKYSVTGVMQVQFNSIQSTQTQHDHGNTSRYLWAQGTLSFRNLSTNRNLSTLGRLHALCGQLASDFKNSNAIRKTTSLRSGACKNVFYSQNF